MPVHFQCKSCGEEHPVPGPLQPRTKVAFDMHVYVSDPAIACPKTGEEARYTKADLVWREEG